MSKLAIAQAVIFFHAGLTCNSEETIRLSGVTSNSTCGFKSGIVQICNNGTWNSICDSDWTIEDAIVACRQLTYSTIGTYVKANENKQF